MVFVRANLKLQAGAHSKRPCVAWNPESLESDGFPSGVGMSSKATGRTGTRKSPMTVSEAVRDPVDFQHN